MIKVGIIGAGNISQKMAETINQMDGVMLWSVAARELSRAQEFASVYQIPKAFGSYQELVQEEEVDLVYVATPNSHHCEAMKLVLNHGKHVLCEKSFTVNADEAREVVALAKAKNLLLAEAIWTRYMPSRIMVNEIIESGVIGKVTSLEANLNYPIAQKERILKAELGGGALLDLGVYVLNFAAMVFGNQVSDINTSCVRFDTGMDAMDSITLRFAGGEMAILHVSALSIANRIGAIYGDKGYVEVRNINNIEKITVYDIEHNEVETYLPPKQITGFEYQVESCMRAIKAGEIECPEMPHDEIIRIMQLMDDIRAMWD